MKVYLFCTLFSSEPELSTGPGIGTGRRTVMLFPCFAKYRDWTLPAQSRDAGKKY